MSLWLFPAPIFAVGATVAAALIAATSFSVAWIMGAGVAWIIGGGFAALASLIGGASLVRRLRSTMTLPRYSKSEPRPTLAILAMMIASEFWLLTIGLHVFDNFFAANRPGGTKYFVTLGVAVILSIYLSFHGGALIRRHFAGRGGRDVMVTPTQALLIIVVAILCGAYFAWIMV